MIPRKEIRPLYSLLLATNEKAVLEEAKKVKEAAAQGKKTRVQFKDPTKKKVRGKDDIKECLEMVLDAVGDGLAPRCLAWAAGNITDGQLFASIEEECKLLGKNWTRPY
jgi:hypothetical protein